VRRSLVSIAFALLSVGGIGLPTSLASATTGPAPADDHCVAKTGCIDLSISFSNRSVTAIGSLYDYSNTGSTTALFDFYVGANEWSNQTRTATSERKSFHFSETGPSGGIDYVEVYLINNSTGDKTWVAYCQKSTGGCHWEI
jgi:hypothetical protein